MKTRFYNGKICTMENSTDWFEGELWVDGSRVAYAGSALKPEMPFDREINLDGNLLMPGFKNAHTHSAMTFLRSYADDLPLLEWLHRQVFPMEAKLTGEDVYCLTKLAVMEYLTSGITACFDMYIFPREVARAAIDCGFRVVMCGSINDFNGTPEREAADYAYFNSCHELISGRLGFHSEYTCSRPLLESMAELAQSLKAPIYCHNSESRSEVEQCLGRWGKTPTEFLDSLGMFMYGGGGFHCVHMTDRDIDIMREKTLWAVTNPASNAKLASGIASISQMLAHGVHIALGTDGPASNNCLDFFREMFLVTALAKLREDDASVVSADTVLRMASREGALAMGLYDCDTLAPGKRADLIVLDLMQPNMQPENNIIKNIVYSGSKQNVKLTMINGKILYRDGEYFIGAEPRDIYAKANAVIRQYNNSK